MNDDIKMALAITFLAVVGFVTVILVMMLAYKALFGGGCG